MSNIKNWSKTPGNNTSSPPNGAPEDWAPSSVNNTLRQQMADHRTQWEDAAWFDWGHVPVQQTANSFLVSISWTDCGAGIYTAGRRLKMYDAGVTIYGEVLASSATGGSNFTLVTVSSSNITASLTSLAVSIFNPAEISLPVSSKTDMEQATISSSQNTLITPSTFKHHIAAAKAWGYVNFSVTGSSYTLIRGWNVLSVTSTTTGLIAITFQVTITGSTVTRYPLLGTAFGPNSGVAPFYCVHNPASTGTIAYVNTYKASTQTLANSSFNFVVHGVKL